MGQPSRMVLAKTRQIVLEGGQAAAFVDWQAPHRRCMAAQRQAGVILRAVADTVFVKCLSMPSPG